MKDHDGAVQQIKRILKPAWARLTVGVNQIRPGKATRAAVSKEEWTRLLAEFRTIEAGETAIGRWALVAKAA